VRRKRRKLFAAALSVLSFVTAIGFSIRIVVFGMTH
jgi:hypothetical protein